MKYKNLDDLLIVLFFIFCGISIFNRYIPDILCSIVLLIGIISCKVSYALNLAKIVVFR